MPTSGTGATVEESGNVDARYERGRGAGMIAARALVNVRVAGRARATRSPALVTQTLILWLKKER